MCSSPRIAPAPSSHLSPASRRHATPQQEERSTRIRRCTDDPQGASISRPSSSTGTRTTSGTSGGGLRRNNGGYFHGEDNLKAKLGIHLVRLETQRWRRVPAAVSNVLPQLNAMFVRRFESTG